ncbi:MAG: hypothetical protein ABSB33_09265 [Tepidisphaeraceae bacterium]|jgi:hypothetical protein
MIFVRCICLIGASLAGCAACWWAAGTSLGLFFGGLFVVTFLTPAAVLGQQNLRSAICALAATVGTVAVVWLIATLKTSDTLGQWFGAATVLLTYALAIAGIAVLPAACKLPEVFAAAMAIVIGLAWLTWPVWLSPTIQKHETNAAVENMVKIHPPLVINGILKREPAWTEMSLAYHLTNLNQDVPIRMPSSAAPCAAFHAVLGIGLCTATSAIARKRRGLYSTIENPLFREKS